MLQLTVLQHTSITHFTSLAYPSKTAHQPETHKTKINFQALPML